MRWAQQAADAAWTIVQSKLELLHAEGGHQFLRTAYWNAFLAHCQSMRQVPSFDVRWKQAQIYANSDMRVVSCCPEQLAVAFWRALMAWPAGEDFEVASEMVKNLSYEHLNLLLSDVLCVRYWSLIQTEKQRRDAATYQQARRALHRFVGRDPSSIVAQFLGTTDTTGRKRKRTA